MGLVGVREPAQHREPSPHGVGARGEPLVRQRLPRGQLGHRPGAQQVPQLRGELPGLPTGGGDREDGVPGAGEGRHGEGAGGAGTLQLQRRRARPGRELLQRRVGTQGVEEAGEVCGRGW